MPPIAAAGYSVLGLARTQSDDLSQLQQQGLTLRC
ncbi:hypothetical protein ALON55S_05311 [Alishewanella longhuensis]